MSHTEMGFFADLMIAKQQLKNGKESVDKNSPIFKWMSGILIGLGGISILLSWYSGNGALQIATLLFWAAVIPFYFLWKLKRIQSKRQQQVNAHQGEE